MLNEIFKMKNETLAIAEAKESRFAGFLANKKIFFRGSFAIPRQIQIYELSYDEEYQLKFYKLINNANGIDRCRISGLKDEVCCNCYRDVSKEEKIWIRKEIQRNYSSAAVHVRQGGYVVCLECAKEYRKKVTAFYEELKAKCEICHQKYSVIRNFSTKGKTIKACDSCIKEYAKKNNLKYNLPY